MKNSKTTIRELSAKYRSILKKCFLLNAMAMGLIVATSTNAAINVTTGTTDISADVITTVVANAKLDTVAEAPEVDNPADHLTDTTYAFTKADGSAGKGNDLASTSAASYTGIASSANGSTVSTTTTLSYESGTLAETNYQYKDGQGNWSIYGSGEKTYTDTYTLGEYAGFQELALTGVNGGLSYDLDGTLYQFGVGATQYTLNDDATKVVKVSDGSETLISSLDDGDLKTAALAAQSEYNGAKTAIQAKQDVIDGYATTEATNYAAAGSTLEADQITVNNLASYKESFDTAKGLYDTDTTAYGNYVAYQTYNNSLSQTVDTKSDARITASLADGGAVKTAIDNAVAYDNTTSGLTATTMQGAIDENAAAITTLNGDSGVSGSVENKIASIVGSANTATGDDPSNATGLFATVDANTSAIDRLNGDENTTGSVAKALADAKAYTDTLENGAVATNTSAISTLNGDENTSGSVAHAVKQLADGAVATNTSAIATLNGDANTPGSVAKAVADEAAARNTAIATATTMGTTDGKNYTAGSSVIAAIESIDSNMGTIHGLVTSASATKTSTNKAYAGNLAVGTTVEDHLLALDASIGDRRTLSGDYVSTGDVVTNLQSLNDGIESLASNAASTQANNERRFAAIDHRINKLEDKMEKGLAATAALTGLSPLPPTEHKTQVSAALGGYGSNQALAVGAFHYINNRTLLNAGAAYGGNSNVSYKVGVTFGF